MEVLEIEPTYTTPQVVFNPHNNLFRIAGSSITENVDGFYSPLLDWLDSYLLAGNPKKIDFTFEIYWFNASSSKKILRLIQKLKNFESKGINICVNWLYCKNDPSMYEIGKDMSSMVQMEFNFISETSCCNPKKFDTLSFN